MILASYLGHSFLYPVAAVEFLSKKSFGERSQAPNIEDLREKKVHLYRSTHLSFKGGAPKTRDALLSFDQCVLD